LIFGLAPVVNTFFTLGVNRELRDQLRGDLLRGSFFAAGLMLVAVGAVVVLVAAPKAAPRPAGTSARAATPVAAPGKAESEPSPSDGTAESVSTHLPDPTDEKL
jgi:hypothetical protein